MTYNDNIEMLRVATKPETLPDGEWFALMVVDDKVADRNGVQERGDARKFFRGQYGWLGFERTSGGQIYISKNFQSRLDFTRGETWIVKVADASRCSVIS